MPGWFEQNAPKTTEQPDWFAANAPTTDNTPEPPKPLTPLQKFRDAVSENLGLTAARDVDTGINELWKHATTGKSDPAKLEQAKKTVLGLAQGIANEPGRVSMELRSFQDKLARGDIPGAMYHLGGSVPLLGAPAQQVAQDIGEGEYAKAAGHAVGLAVPFTRPVAKLKAATAPRRPPARVEAPVVRAPGPSDITISQGRTGGRVAEPAMPPPVEGAPTSVSLRNRLLQEGAAQVAGKMGAATGIPGAGTVARGVVRRGIEKLPGFRRTAPPPEPVPEAVAPAPVWRTSTGQTPESFTPISARLEPEVPPPLEVPVRQTPQQVVEALEAFQPGRYREPGVSPPVEAPPVAAAPAQPSPAARLEPEMPLPIEAPATGAVSAAPLEPWQSRKADLVPSEQMRPRSKTPSDVSGGYTEAEINARALRNRSAETDPPNITRHPVGSWGRDADGELMQLREYSLDDPKLIFTENPGRNLTVEKYVGWIEQGNEPPPLRAVETEKGSIKIQEGNHRAAAIRATGGNKVKVWTAVTKNRPIGQGQVMPEGVTHEAAIRNALAEGRTVPPEVLADYPDLVPAAPRPLEAPSRTVPIRRPRRAAPAAALIQPEIAAAEVFKPAEPSLATVPKAARGKTEGMPTKDAAEYQQMRAGWQTDPGDYPGAVRGSPFAFRRGEAAAPKVIRKFPEDQLPALAKAEGVTPQAARAKLKADGWIVKASRPPVLNELETPAPVQ